jgi:hypothetical protein
VGGGETVLGRVLVEAAGSELQDSLDTYVQGFHLMKGDGVKTHTLLAVKGPQSADGGSEAIGS